MNKLERENGITLIALIITIIILVILAAVSIRAVTNMKIVDYAVNGSQNYAKAGKAENKVLDDTVSFLDEAVKKVSNASKGSITNPYANEEWIAAWTCTNGTWSNYISDNTQTLTGDVVAKLYQKGEEDYRLVIEKIGASGVMGAYLKSNLNSWGSFHNFSEDYITEVIICDGIEVIGDTNFSGLENLTTVQIPNTITSIERYAFDCCRSLTSITIPDGVTSLGEGVFRECNKLETIEIPSTVSSIGFGCMATTSNLTTVYIHKGENEINVDWYGPSYNVENGLSEEEGHYNLKIKYNDAEHTFNYYLIQDQGR